MSNAEKLETRPFRRRGHVALVLLVIAVSLLAALIPARVNAQDSGGDSNKSTPEYTKWDDLSGKTVGMVTGATFETALREKCPNVGDVGAQWACRRFPYTIGRGEDVVLRTDG